VPAWSRFFVSIPPTRFPLVKFKFFLASLLLTFSLGSVGQTAPVQQDGSLISAAVQPQSGSQRVATGDSGGDIRAGHVLVRFKANPSQDVLNQLVATFGARVIGTIHGIDVTHLQVPAGSERAIIDNLRRRPDVDFAEFDSIVKAIVQPSSSTQTTFQPNDTYYSTAYPSSHYGNTAQWGRPPSRRLRRGGSLSVIAAL